MALEKYPTIEACRYAVTDQLEARLQLLQAICGVFYNHEVVRIEAELEERKQRLRTTYSTSQGQPNDQC